MHLLALLALSTSALAADLYGTDTTTDLLVRIDTDTAVVTEVGPLGFGNTWALAYDPGSGVLYGADRTTDELLTIDVETGVATAVGPIGIDLNSLAWDDTNDVLFGLSTSASLYTINTSTGAATSIGATGISDPQGLVVRPSDGVLYATNRTQNNLFTVNRTTGASTVVGTTGVNDVRGLAWDADADVLYGVTSFGTDRLLSIDPDTASVTVVGDMTTSNIRGLTFFAPNPPTARFRHQGVVLGADGRHVSGAATLHLSLYADATPTTPLWTETHNVIAEEGYYAIEVGSIEPIPTSLFDGSARYLGIALDPSTTPTTLTPVLSVPYAVHSESVSGQVRVEASLTPCDADHLGTMDFSDDVLSVCTSTGWTPLH